MLKLIRPNLEYKDKYIEMIKEWNNFGSPFEPCIIEYDCSNSIDELNYNAVIDVVNNYYLIIPVFVGIEAEVFISTFFCHIVLAIITKKSKDIYIPTALH